MISTRAARLLLSQHFWWAHGERSLRVGLPTDTPRAPTIGACHPSAAKRRPLQRRERTRGARARRSRGLAAKRAAIGSAAVGHTNSSHTRPYSRASARSLQERLTSCRRQPRPTVTSEARVGPFVQPAFLKTNASQVSRRSRPPKVADPLRIHGLFAGIASYTKPAPPGTSRKVEEIPAAKKSAPRAPGRAAPFNETTAPVPSGRGDDGTVLTHRPLRT